MSADKYAIITPCRNEENTIRKTIDSVVAQTVKPVIWVIVSDSSTDSTDEIIQEYASQYDFIQYCRYENPVKRNFASKVYAFWEGYKHLGAYDYNFVGNLDADVSFEPHYFETLIHKFSQNPKLGIAGGKKYDFYDNKLHERFSHPTSIPGSIQLFRKECYEEIGGYIPLRYGGVDTFVEIMARKHGWQTRSFSELQVLHWRKTGTAEQSLLSARYRQGLKDYVLGYSFVYSFIRYLSRIRLTPFMIGSFMQIYGFSSAMIQRIPIEVPDEFVHYVRSEQYDRLKFWKTQKQSNFYQKESEI